MITITTVGYGDYTPITPIGRIIAVVVMFSGIGIVVTLVTLLSQRRLPHTESMLKLKLKPEVRPKLSGDETKTAIKDEIDEIEKMTRTVIVLLTVSGFIGLGLFTINLVVVSNSVRNSIVSGLSWLA